VANIKSQIKRNRQNETARVRNKTVKTALKTVQKKFLVAAESGDRDAATTALQTASQTLDKAVTKGVMHANTAANRKSKMARRVNNM